MMSKVRSRSTSSSKNPKISNRIIAQPSEEFSAISDGMLNK